MKKLISIFALLSVVFSCATTNTAVKSDNSFSIKKIIGKEFVLENIYKDLSITIGFDKEKVFGFAGINRYFGPYKIEGNKIEFKNLATTMMAGPPSEMKAEKEYLEMMSKATSISSENNTLTLKLSNGKELIFKKK